MTSSSSSDNKTQKVRVALHATHLKNVAGFGKGTSDPYAVLTVLPNNPSEQPQLMGRTEVIKNSLSPHWTQTFTLDYELGQLTRFNVGIYDEIRKAKHNKPMGSCLFEVGEILGLRGNVKAKKLRNGGTLFCRITAVPREQRTVALTMRGVGLKNVEGLFGGKSDPFLEVLAHANTPSGLTWQPIYRTKHINNNLNPSWPRFELHLRDMEGTEEDILQRPLQMIVYDWEKSGKHRKIGQVETNLQCLLDGVTASAAGANVNPKRVDLSKALTLKNRKNNKSAGHLVVTQAAVHGEDPSRTTTAPTSTAMSTESPYSSLTPVPVPVMPDNHQSPPTFNSTNPPTFVDYLSGGCELGCSFAIDFTGSNGDPRKPGTLHHISNNNQLNEYEKCITSVGDICGRYDADQKFPVQGFGAKFGGVINHCFQVGAEPELDGLPQVLQAYRGVFQTGLTMSGPTVLAEVIDMGAARARSAQEAAAAQGKQAYQILLILTDGAVTDVNQTKAALERASDAPLSIVIIGIGRADFTRMQFLDDFADHNPNVRDICQFVEFSKYAQDKSALTRETLDEIPDQLVDYFYHKQGIMPLPPISGSQVFNIDEADEEEIDLSIDYNSEQEITLGSLQNLPKYDDTKYDTADTYMNVTPVPVPSAPPAPQQEPVATPVYDAPNSRSEQPPPNPSPFSQALGGSRQQAPTQQQIFHVQVPAGVASGQRLQVQNPQTQQYMIVTVPHGVGPGGKFAVAY